MQNLLQEPPLGLYIHIPWCVRKCPYCDFNSHKVDQVMPEKAYIDALLRDLDRELPRVAGRTIHSIFFGGGTPSLFSVGGIDELVCKIRQRTNLSAELEITLEANPGTLEKDKFNGFRDAGVNRLSIGIQSFQSQHLQSLGRIHSADEAGYAVESAHAAGFDNFNIDLMFGLPKQSLADALADVKRAIALKPSHLSFYQLTIEPHTFFYKNRPILPKEDIIWEIQQACYSYLNQCGYYQYEISAFAANSNFCQHNLNYWQFGDYVGIGAGAHGKITQSQTNKIIRYYKVKHPLRYLEIMATDEPCGNESIVTEESRVLEFLMNALRLNQGFELSMYSQRTGLSATTLEPQLSACIDEGLLERKEMTIRCTVKGRNFLDDVLSRFTIN